LIAGFGSFFSEFREILRGAAAMRGYEEDFLGFSYGFRPKRGQHNALDALVVGIKSRRVNFTVWIPIVASNRD
jgi:hypothetical protein